MQQAYQERCCAGNEGPNGNWANLLRVLAQIALLQGVGHCEYTKNTTTLCKKVLGHQ